MKRGFTLVEMLVSISIISFVFLAATGIYSFSIRSQIKSTELSSLQQEANYVLSLITKDIRNSRVDYSYYGVSIPQPSTSDLALKDSLDNQIIYTRSDTKIMKNNQPLTSSEIEVTTLQFYISPTTDPFNSSGITHPRVTIVLELKAKGQSFRLQQTVMQRYGERK